MIEGAVEEAVSGLGGILVAFLNDSASAPYSPPHDWTTVLALTVKYITVWMHLCKKQTFISVTVGTNNEETGHRCNSLMIEETLGISPTSRYRVLLPDLR